MINYLRTWTGLKTDKRAVTMLEYGLVAALICGIIAAAMATLGTDMTNLFATVTSNVAAAT